MKNPTVFISYSWDNPSHKDWVIALTNELRRNGIDATLDEFITQKGTVNLNRMMIENIMRSDYTLVILTDKYADKSNEFNGGVGYETSLLINNIMENVEKIIPIMRYKGDRSKAVPFYLKGISYIDFSNDSDFGEKFEELKYKILKIDRIAMEPLGTIPTLKSRMIGRETLYKEARKEDVLIPDFREITDKDKNKFIKDSYSEIIHYLTDLAEQTKQKNHNFDYDIDLVTNKKHIIKFYINGMEKQTVKIWLDNKFSKQENILLSYGRFGIDSDNSWNEMITCEANEKKELILKMTMNMFGNGEPKNSKEISIEIWKYVLQFFK
ncbi:toll/interleukin-1 receptor domain-containing protein [Tissierella pigra]|uniref:TIR domain-containing protein n=1 Tax=Tissierella pigra TaxID=2607614 RepID=A0A6N7Y4K5_9FIRM|nr:toll/interleukin-1 receptor domain-containing protein [Tissierella pigra]MSU02980.1 TIR domain-containing protein [Tissierella pigra]